MPKFPAENRYDSMQYNRCSRSGLKLAQPAIAWSMRHPQITSVLIGAGKTTQIEDAAATLNNLKISREELEKIDPLV
jgi:L-glyceraldehyde 3-phosphate reductase